MRTLASCYSYSIDLGITKRRKKRRQVQTTDATTGQTTTGEVEEDDDAQEAAPLPVTQAIKPTPEGQAGAGG